jgi:hypothetical protein
MSAEAWIVVKIDRGEAKSFEISSPDVRALKHEIYLLSFEDFAGENAKALTNWKAANYIKDKRSK